MSPIGMTADKVPIRTVSLMKPPDMPLTRMAMRMKMMIMVIHDEI
jgi:hypothetical protein